MFTWICPQCGREVPPSYDECPDCAGKTAQAESPAEIAAPEPVQLPAKPKPEAYRAPAPVRSFALPSWLLAIVFALAFFGVVGGAYWLVGYLHGRGAATPAASVESPAAKPGAKTNPFQRYIEVSGLRFTADPKHPEKPLIKFVLTNHSETAIRGLSGNVTVWGRTQSSEEDAQGTFTFTTDIAAFQSKDMTEPLNTKLKIYELPDWQNATPDLQVTAPGGVYPDSPEPH